jgi:hypothetical protein
MRIKSSARGGGGGNKNRFLSDFLDQGIRPKSRIEYLNELQLCARCLTFKLHFSYLLNRHLRGCLHVGRWLK